MSEMFEAVMARMDSHPEEFIHPDGKYHTASKWDWFTTAIRDRVAHMHNCRQAYAVGLTPNYGLPHCPYLTDAQVERAYAKLVELEAYEFDIQVQRTLLSANEDDIPQLLPAYGRTAPAGTTTRTLRRFK